MGTLSYAGIYGSLVLVMIPSIILHMTDGTWINAFDTSLKAQIFRSLFILTLLPGISSAIEFVKRGKGTPIPFDPPKKMVTSGLYSYVANPMQMSCFLSYIFLGSLLENYWVCLGSLAGWSWSMGVALINEKSDMKSRFGDKWTNYRSHVKNWLPRKGPVPISFADSDIKTPTVYISETCGKCNKLGKWIKSLNVVNLKIVAAENHPSKDLMRLTYDPCDGSGDEDGVAGLMRALEHVNFSYALVSSVVRIPGIIHLVQLIVDVVGGGPRLISRQGNKCRIDVL